MSSLLRTLRAHGARDDRLDVLSAYVDRPIAEVALEPARLPLVDEPHIARWSVYADEARSVGSLPALERRFPQLQFPVREGISQDPAYRGATRRGERPRRSPGDGPDFRAPESVVLSVHESMAGRIPVIVASERVDFELLVQAFTERNEPVPVPRSMGACIVKGFNNWDRIREYRKTWEAGNDHPTERAWLQEFEAVKKQKALYQDTFIILSGGPYSAVSSDALSLGPEQWTRESVAIRREHELFHYFTHRVFGSMRNNILDELLADFIGLLRVYGEYRTEYALRFLGLEEHPTFREGGRLENYREPPLPDDCLPVIQSLCVAGIENLHRISETLGSEVGSLLRTALLAGVLAGRRLDELSQPENVTRICEEFLNHAKSPPA